MQITNDRISEFARLLDAARGLLADESDSADALDANELVSQALAIVPHSSSAWILKCQVLSSLCDDTAALACIEQAVRYAPQLPEANYWHGAVLADLLRYGDALDAIEICFRYLDRDDSWILEDLYFEKAMILNALGRHREAAATYKAGLKQCPHSRLLRSGLAPAKRTKAKSKLVVVQGGLSEQP